MLALLQNTDIGPTRPRSKRNTLNASLFCTIDTADMHVAVLKTRPNLNPKQCQSRDP